MDGVCKIQLLSTKRAVFMDKDYKSRDQSTKRAIFMDSKRLCTESLGDLVRKPTQKGRFLIYIW